MTVSDIYSRIYDLNDDEIYEMFDYGVFNKIVKGYVKMVIDNKGTIEELLDDVSSAEAVAYLDKIKTIM